MSRAREWEMKVRRLVRQEIEAVAAERREARENAVPVKLEATPFPGVVKVTTLCNPPQFLTK